MLNLFFFSHERGSLSIDSKRGTDLMEATGMPKVCMKSASLCAGRPRRPASSSAGRAERTRLSRSQSGSSAASSASGASSTHTLCSHEYISWFVSTAELKR